MTKTLYLEKRGCDFSNDTINEGLSDVGNYRVGSYDYSIKGKDGRTYTLEFGGCEKKNYRTTNKRTGKPLKKPVIEIVQRNALHINTQYEASDGYTYRNPKLERDVYQSGLSYTKADILKVVNEISSDVYTNIQFIDWG